MNTPVNTDPATGNRALKTATPAEIDRELSDLNDAALAAHRRRTGEITELRGLFDVTDGRGDAALSDDAIIAAARDAITTGAATADVISQAKRLLSTLDVEHAIQGAQRARWSALEDEHASRGGWSRFFLEQASNGHIHSTLGCSTCHQNGTLTRFTWLTDLSGSTEKAAVKAHGAVLCAVCFPSAPVEWTNHYEAAAAAKKAPRCPGSGGRHDPDLPHRTGYYSGNWATCSSCGKRASLTPTNKLRSHKA